MDNCEQKWGGNTQHLGTSVSSSSKTQAVNIFLVKQYLYGKGQGLAVIAQRNILYSSPIYVYFTLKGHTNFSIYLNSESA